MLRVRRTGRRRFHAASRAAEARYADREVEQAAVSPSCPGCGAACRAGAVLCASCGFALVESGRARRRPGGAAAPHGGGAAPHRAPRIRRALLAAAGAAVAALAAVVLVSGGGDEPSAAVGRPAAVSALEAEMLLELRFGGPSDEETTAVRCPGPIERGRIVRCELLYADGIPRAVLVRLTPRGDLEADIPYPATLRGR
jgi:hypothetical protein